MDEENVSLRWTQLITNHRDDPKLRSRTCHIYNRRSKQPLDNAKQRCPCGRLTGRHSLDGACLESQALDKGDTWICPKVFYDNKTHSCQVRISVFGVLTPRGCKFLRIDNRFKVGDSNELYHLYQLILDDCDGKKPGLLLTVAGGAKYFTLKERLQKEVVRGIIETASRADAWILTDGTDTGMSKLVGEGVSHYHLLHEYSNKIKCIGLTMWGTISENARLDLKKAIKEYPEELLCRQIPTEEQEDKDSVELNHTHCILFDGGRLNEYLSDSHRDNFVEAACNDSGSTCYAVTIIFGGDLNTLNILENDIRNKRPVVFIQDSGRLTDMLVSVLDMTSNDTWDEHWNPTDREIRTAFDIYFPSYTDDEAITALKQIKAILDKTHRYLFSVFRFYRSNNVVRTIFHAILSAKKIGKQTKNDIGLAKDSLKVARHLHENRLIDLAFDWNYIDGAVPILQRWQDKVMNKKLHLEEKHAKRDNEIVKKSLENNRPTFVDFFLSAGFDLRELTETKHESECEQFIWKLYNKSCQMMSEGHRSRVTALFGKRSPNSREQLQKKLFKFIGPFVGSLNAHSSKSFEERICIGFCKCIRCYRRHKQYPVDQLELSTAAPNENDAINQGSTQKEYSKDEMLRDLFLWAVFMDMPEMAKVLLIQMRSRLCAALVASAIFKQYAKLASTVYLEEKLRGQALDFEEYAAKCIDQCYEYNERTACELLFRQVPLFGYVTCMQVAISSESEKVLETACYDQALNQVWYGRLASSNGQIVMKPSLLLSTALVGLSAPISMNYREKEKRSITDGTVKFDLSSEGIDYYVNEESSTNWFRSTYWSRFRYFHESPMIEMCYHFISYVWFLLVFSYMMLYHIDNRMVSKNHWTEIYVIITVTTMLYEEVRKTLHDYNTQMLEQWISPRSTVQAKLAKAFEILPYLLFYLGLGFRFGSGDNDDVLSTARIILALDLEIWYLQSLKFVIALKFLGPKLFMLKNMLRDLFAFVYLIFVAIAAYGVVSRSLIFYRQVPFTARGIFKEIFYAPYWFMYTVVTDKDELEARLQNKTSEVVAEATATQVLLTFHMLFINILLLNLLVAVFANTIGKVQQNTEFYWRYQRYSFVREYFQRPILAYPPLIIVPHIILLAFTIKRKFCVILGKNRVENHGNISKSKSWTPVFKMIPKSEASLDEHWDLFENAATYSYARSILEKHQRKDTFGNDENSPENSTTTTTLNFDRCASRAFSEKLTSTADEQQTMSSVKEELTILKSAFTGIQQDLNKVVASQQCMMDALSRVKLNESQQLPWVPNLPSFNHNAMTPATIDSGSQQSVLL